jgi:hypothetical protein
VDKDREIALAKNRVQKMGLAYGDGSTQHDAAKRELARLVEAATAGDLDSSEPIQEPEVITEETAPKPEPDLAQRKDAADAGGGSVFLPEDGLQAVSVSEPPAATRELIEGGASAQPNTAPPAPIEEHPEDTPVVVETTATSSVPEVSREDDDAATGLASPTGTDQPTAEPPAAPFGENREPAPEAREIESKQA